MRPLTAVVYGIGAMGALMTRVLVERDITVVGAIARNPGKVGRDLGHVAGLGRELGVVISNDADSVLAQSSPDVAILALNSYLHAHAPHIEVCLRHRANVITLCEEALYPWWTSPALTTKLDALARTNGVSVLGSGHQDALWVGIGAQLLGCAHRVDEVRWSSTWNPEGGGPELLAAMGIGRPPGVGHGTRHDPLEPSFAIAAVDAIAALLGLDQGERTVTSEPVLSTEAVYSASLGRMIAVGQVVGISDVVRRVGRGEPTLSFSMTGRLLADGEHVGESWEVTGSPDLRLSTSYASGEHTQVAAQAANRIPDVVAARPGWLTHADLPPLRYQGQRPPAH